MRGSSAALACAGAAVETRELPPAFGAEEIRSSDRHERRVRAGTGLGTGGAPRTGFWQRDGLRERLTFGLDQTEAALADA